MNSKKLSKLRKLVNKIDEEQWYLNKQYRMETVDMIVRFVRDEEQRCSNCGLGETEGWTWDHCPKCNRNKGGSVTFK